MCKRCGETKNVKIDRFIDQNGKRRVSITCDILVHADPVITVVDDPSTPTSSIGAGGSSLVHRLRLYRKLVDVVYSFDGPVEYAVIEHELATKHPDVYEQLLERYGHATEDEVSGYTLSTYLASLLGTLAKERSLENLDTSATSPWQSGSTSAWSHPERSDGPVRSWQDHAEAEGLDPEAWPATRQLAAA